jgi:membrane associated rhomboid family serine protease
MDNLTPVVKKILFINVAVFILCKVFNTEIINLFALHSLYTTNFKWYQLFTHLFIHLNLWHLLSNIITLISFGPSIEARMGSKRFLFFYLVVGSGASLFYILCSYLENKYKNNLFLDYISNPTPEVFIEYIKHFPSFYEYHYGFIYDYIQNPQDINFIEKSKSMLEYVYNLKSFPLCIGASGAIFGILTAFAMLYPNAQLAPLFIPIGIPSKYIVIFYGLYELYAGLTNSITDNIAHFAHIGGILIAYIFIKIGNRKRY